MATRATFDLPRSESMAAVTKALDDLHEVSWRTDDAAADPADDSTSAISVSIAQTPLWAYPIAAAIIIGPWLTASLAGWARFSTASGEGLSMSTNLEGNSATLLAVAGVVALVVSLTVGWWIVTKFKRPAHQATVSATGNADDTVTDLVMNGSPERYIHLAVRKVFDTHDREAIAKREAEGQFSIGDFLGIGGGGNPFGGEGRAGGLGALLGGQPRGPVEDAAEPAAASTDTPEEVASELSDQPPAQPPVDDASPYRPDSH